MSKWLITATEIKNYYLVVEAEDRSDAMLIAERDYEMSDFDHSGGEFTIDYADPYEDEDE